MYVSLKRLLHPRCLCGFVVSAAAFEVSETICTISSSHQRNAPATDSLSCTVNGGAAEAARRAMMQADTDCPNAVLVDAVQSRTVCGRQWHDCSTSVS